MNAVLSNKKEEFELGLTCILGASIFELTIGLAIGCLLIRKKYTIDFTNLTKDLLIYFFTLIILFFYIQDGNINFTKVNDTNILELGVNTAMDRLYDILSYEFI
jgi:Ca2+/Na+ antiporter